MKKIIAILTVILTLNFMLGACSSASNSVSDSSNPTIGSSSKPKNDPYEREDSDLDGSDDFGE